ncbi:uncharacterized protein LOC110441832 [Mizuhopecten yessoensis]|uniref:uncharacterized protein LOC110441832 n=1 Tax=Mizuhopecten yessoensis TaxID=6573 RepID=UPI000B45F1F6|nr:uncharacterized protein LOC110441832 [Mizuhopecten yessoensis]
MDHVHGFKIYGFQLGIQFADKLQFINICLQKVYNFLRGYIITLLSSLKRPVRPGQPRSTDIGTDYICLEWDKIEKDEVSHYEIRIKVAGDHIWSSTIVSTKDRQQPFHRFNELLQNTRYEFMVRAVYSDGCDSDFSCKSAEITTGCSKVCGILKYCKKIIDGPPSVYRLPLVEIQSSKDDDQKTRKCRYGNSTCLREKTVLMVGPRTGGKTTLINGLVNHSLGVKWEHEYRLKITDEPEITSSRQESPTEWITSYKVHPVTTDTDFILNIIDTPSFHEGPESYERNQNLLQRLKFFLSTRGPKGMNGIDAVCFVSQANPVTFSGIDKAFSDILDGIVSIFGDNMHGNIIPMLTFADGKEPSVLKILSTVGVPTQRFFVFNSSTLFPPYTEDALLGKTSWKLSSRGFEGFLNHLSNMKPCPALKTTPMTTTQPNKKKATRENDTSAGKSFGD